MTRQASTSQKNQTTADRLHSAAIHLLRRLRRVDEATGLSAVKLSALSVVVFAGPIALGDLAAAEQVRPPTMTRLIQELESQGLIRRNRDKDDQRIVRIEATPRGEKLLKQGRYRRVAMLAEWINTLSPREIMLLNEAAEVLEEFARPHK